MGIQTGFKNVSSGIGWFSINFEKISRKTCQTLAPHIMDRKLYFKGAKFSLKFFKPVRCL